MEVSLRLNI